MVERIKKIIGEVTCIDEKLINNDLHLVDDLYLDTDDIEAIVEALEDYYNTEFDQLDGDLIYVADIIALVKARV